MIRYPHTVGFAVDSVRDKARNNDGHSASCYLTVRLFAVLLAGWTALAGAAETVGQQLQPVAHGLDFGGRVFDWGTAVAVHPSIRRTSFAVEKPRLMRGACARVDLTDPRLRYLVTGRDKDWGQPMPDYTNRPLRVRTRRQTTRDFLLAARRPVAEGGRGLNMLLAVNNAQWLPWEKPFNHRYADNMSLVVSDGEMVSPPIGFPSFIVYRDGAVEFRNVARGEALTNILHAVSGWGMILENGTILKADTPEGAMPRTVFGLSEGKRYLYLYVVDGRQPEYSMGATPCEAAQWMLYFGADSAMNMDGGGSATLICWDPVPDPTNTDPKSKDTPNLHKLNHQEGNHERAVGCNLGFYFINNKEQP